MKINEGVRSAKKRFPEYQDHIDKIALYLDPTPTKKYTEWLVWMFLKELKWAFNNDPIIFFHFKDAVRPLFEKFYELTQNHIMKGKESDIWSYNNIQEIRDAVAIHEEKRYEKMQVPVKKYDYDEIPVYFIETKEQAQKYGYRSKWCISSVLAMNRFDQYNSENFVFFVFLKDRKFCTLIRRTDYKFVVWNDLNKTVDESEITDLIPKSFFYDIIVEQKRNTQVNIKEEMLGGSTEPRNSGRGFGSQPNDSINHYLNILKQGKKLRLRSGGDEWRGKYVMLKGDGLVLFDPQEVTDTPIGMEFLVKNEFEIHEVLTKDQKNILVELMNTSDWDVKNDN
jgi:hypothetical protein